MADATFSSSRRGETSADRTFRPADAEASGGFSWAVLVALAIVLPNQLTPDLGGVVLTPVRVTLLLLALPGAAAFLGDPRLPFRTYDALYLGFAGWTGMCILINRGLGAKGVQDSGQFLLETAALYLIVQASVTTLRRFETMTRFLFGAVLIIGLLAIPEFVLGEHYLQNAMRRLAGEPEIVGTLMPDRFGLTRTTSVFSHPILYGVFCAAILSLTIYAAQGFPWLKVAVIGAATAMSMSSAPILVLFVQLGAVAAERVTRGIRHRAAIIAGGIGAVVAALQLFTGKGVFGLVVIFTLNPSTAYYRRETWNNGIDDVLRNPVFGMNPEDWTRLFWMTPSIDNYWLFQGMRGGLPSLVLIACAIMLIVRALFRRPAGEVDPRLHLLARGWCFTMLAMVLCGATVHFFDKLQPYFALLLALGAALARIIDAAPAAHDAAPKPATRRTLL